ncbi:MAG: DUF4920 domain-containing protein [Bacteroidota bacterium]
MKKIFLFCLSVAMSATLYAQTGVPADSVSADGLMSFHGQRISTNDAIPAEKLSEKLGLLDLKKVEDLKLSGSVEACCQAKGCWMSMKINGEQEMMVKFRDYGFFVPIESAGKTAVVQGTLVKETTSVEELRHYAIDGGMSPEEAEKKYTEPVVGLSFIADGAVIIEEESEK